MSGEERRDGIVRYLSCRDKPVSGAALAREFGVSRQVIVQDIALLRTANKEILSTNRGYLVQKSRPAGCERVFKCCHTVEQAIEELNCIVDQGGVVENVYVRHKVYGKIEAGMNIRSRRDVNEYIERIRSGKSTLLMKITSDYHYHTVLAESEEVLDAIERELGQHRFLVPRRGQGTAAE